MNATQVTLKEWFRRPIAARLYMTYNENCPPRADLQAARPPAVKLWEGFCSQAETYFDSIAWPEVNVPGLWLDGFLGDGHTQSYGEYLSNEEAANRLLRIYDPATTCYQTQYIVVPEERKGRMIKLGNKDVVTVMTFDDEYNDLSNFQEYTHALGNETCIERLVERIYGHLIWAGVAYGVLVTKRSCTFVGIDPSTGCLMISPTIQHDDRSFTAKQGLVYVVDLASKQAPFNMLANLGPRKRATASRKKYLELFKGINNTRILRIEDIKLGELIGSGNGAEVYAAEIKGTPIALKVAHVGGALDTCGSWDTTCPQRLAQEAKVYEALTTLQGCVIPKMYAHGLLKNRVGDFLPFLAMEKIDGMTLDEAEERLPKALVPRATKSVMAAYQKLHAQGYVQGSVKGVNVMLRPDGRAVIIDFGRGKQRETIDMHNVHCMLRWFLNASLKVDFYKTDALLSKYAEELQKEEAEQAQTQAIKTPRPKLSHCSYSDAVQAFNVVLDKVLGMRSFRKLAWSEADNQVPVATRVKGRKLTWTASGKEFNCKLMTMIRKLHADLTDKIPALRGYNSRNKRRVALFNAFLRSQLQPKLCQ